MLGPKMSGQSFATALTRLNNMHLLGGVQRIGEEVPARVIPDFRVDQVGGQADCHCHPCFPSLPIK